MDDINYNNIEERLYKLVSEDLVDIQKLLYVVLVERGQLYGALIKLMQLTETEEFEMTVEDRKEISETLYALFLPGEDKTSLTVKLMRKGEEYHKEDEPA